MLSGWRSGDAGAGRELIARMQPELRKIAAYYIARELPGNTLQPTAMVNELFVRLMGGAAVDWQNRSHFLAVASQQLRRILVDHARGRLTAKRGAGRTPTTLTESVSAVPPVEDHILDLHQALEELAELDERPARVIELRYFGGLTEVEAAEALGVSVATLKRDWQIGRAWLADRLSRRQP
ncbi:MAG: sigma-70 family RNA polymerase sigma factor [Bryobacterales bacterium]|nr:sigma-70 family RNA polymerase sigma factor [Bryobacterales bacterium]